MWNLYQAAAAPWAAPPGGCVVTRLPYRGSSPYAGGLSVPQGARTTGQLDRLPVELVRVAEAMGEATVPAEQPASGQATWVPAPDGDQGGSSHHQVTPGQGPYPAVGLIWRVRDRATFRALRRARRARCGPLTLAWLDDGRPPPPRVAFGISRHVGNAVTRNRLRRRLRELARHSSLPAGVWFVTASPGAGDASFASLAGWWDEGVASLRATAAGSRR